MHLSYLFQEELFHEEPLLFFELSLLFRSRLYWSTEMFKKSVVLKISHLLVTKTHATASTVYLLYILQLQTRGYLIFFSGLVCGETS